MNKNNCIENSDWVCIINPETKSDTEELYLVFKMLKRRYRSSETDEKLRRLDYFAQPFEHGNEIRLEDDANDNKPKGLTSLSTQFMAVEEKKKKNATEREVKSDTPEQGKKKKGFMFDEDDELNPFEDNKALNF